MAAGAEVDALDPRAEAVTLLTLHAAKGLEFPVVFLVGGGGRPAAASFPGTTLTDEELAEERRLFFVGLTRAQDRLYLGHTRRRTVHGAQRDSGRVLSSTRSTAACSSGSAKRLRRPTYRQPRLLSEGARARRP